jgi:hypothetical protein
VTRADALSASSQSASSQSASLSTGLQEDNYLQKLVKYIPGEVVAAHAAAAGIMVDAATGKLKSHPAFIVWIGFLTVVAFLWTMVATQDKQGRFASRTSWFQSVVASIAYLVWVFALGTGIKEIVTYPPFVGSLLLIGATLVIPLLEKIFVPSPKP